MKRSLHYRLWLLLALFVAVGLTATVFKTRMDGYESRIQRRSDVAQLADLPLELANEWDPRMVLLDAWERALIPRAEQFASPLGSANGAFTYNAQAFMEMNERRGGRHAGDDLNGIGGMDTDLGDPVYAAADGLVVYSGKPSDDWGEVMILAHRLPEGRVVQSFYGHVGKRRFHCGDWVGRGERIACLGDAGSSTAAHLHFEIISSVALEAGQRGYFSGPQNRLDTQAFIRERQSSAAAAKTPLGLDLKPKPEIRLLGAYD